MNYVIGSGPAGVSCAYALIGRGLPVTMVDAGLTLEPERRRVVERMGALPPRGWDSRDVARVKEGMDASAGGVVLKRVFGSDFAYSQASETTGLHSPKAALMPSFALGGLSNVWGAAMLPYLDRDLAEWPIKQADLAPHYSAVLGFTGLAGQNDRLAEWLDLYTTEAAPLQLSRQAQRLWRHLEKHQAALRRRGFLHGASRLGVRAKRSPEAPGCVYCGMCMYGCPYDHIYSSAWTVRQLQENPLFRYEPGVVVERLQERGGTVQLSGHRLGSREPWRAAGEKAFLAAGVLPSTRIVLHSQEAYDRPVYIKDSQYYLFPLLQLMRSPGVRTEALTTLSQLFLELNDPAVSPNTIHLQLYTYSDIISGAMKKTLGPLGFDWLVRQLDSRMMIVQGYLHSDHSSRLRVELKRDPERDQLCVETEANPGVPAAVRRVVRKLLRQAPALQALPLEPLLQIAAPGRGFHSGGSLPMREKPAAFETDLLGRPHGWERVHVVDSTVFPSIPATTITFSVMANAHRIGALA